jgi:hypothetical protein
MTKNKTNQAIDIEWDKLHTLTTDEWAERMYKRYRVLMENHFDYRYSDIPPGWRRLVEDVLDFAQDSVTENTTPQLFVLAVANGTLILQFTHGGLRLLQTVKRIVYKAARVCELCGSESPDVVLRKVGRDFAHINSDDVLITQRRICAVCASTAAHPLEHSRYALQVMTTISEAHDTKEKTALRAYRDALVEQPTRIVPIPDLQQLKSTLDAEYPWYADVTRRITRSLAGRLSGNGWYKLRPLLLSGAPGAGKSSYIQRLAELSGVPTRLLPLGGEHSSMLLKGTSRGWSTARPCAALEFIKDTGVANPILVLDELDKAGGSDHNGNVHEALLQFIEPETAGHYFDSFLMGTANLAWVSWVATVNDHRRLPQALLSRMEVVLVAMPQSDHYPAIVERCMARYAKEQGIPQAMMPVLGQSEWHWLQRYWTSPRITRRAVEELLAALLSEPRLSGITVH